MQNYSINQELLKKLPFNPGVYLFKNKKGEVLYVGKAKNLKSRISSYFLKKVLPKTALMVSSSHSISIIKTSTEIEALLLEAKLVRKLMPKFNSELKDDKTPLYIAFTKEEYPRLLTLRKTQLKEFKLKFVWGPFTQSTSVRSVMKMLRRIFPYSQHKPGKRPCIYHQIGLCSPCPSLIVNQTDQIKKTELQKQFKRNLRFIKKFLDGKFTSLKIDLQKQMMKASLSDHFELAQYIKNQINMIDHITSTSHSPEEFIKDPNLIEDIREKELNELKNLLDRYLTLEKLHRIECFDIAHLGGTSPTASMVTFINGETDKTYYRHFKVHNKNSDVDNIHEVLRRRLNHLNDWGVPDLIIVDGGKPQVSKALEVVQDIPLIGLAKRLETLVVYNQNKFIEIRLKRGPAMYLVQRLRDEAHRFARRLHHKQVSKTLIGK